MKSNGSTGAKAPATPRALMPGEKGPDQVVGRDVPGGLAELFRAPVAAGPGMSASLNGDEVMGS